MNTQLNLAMWLECFLCWEVEIVETKLVDIVDSRKKGTSDEVVSKAEGENKFVIT